MAKTTVVWRHGMHFCTSTASGQHRGAAQQPPQPVMCDESSEIGATYPSSPELLMASLGSCIGSVLVYFSDRHGISLEGMSIDLDWTIAEHPHRLGQIAIDVTIPGARSAEEKRVLARVAEDCLIHNTLTHPPEIKLTLSAGAKPGSRHGQTKPGLARP